MACDSWLTSRSEDEDGAAAGKDRRRRDMNGSDELGALDTDIPVREIVRGRVMRLKRFDCVLRGWGSFECRRVNAS